MFHLMDSFEHLSRKVHEAAAQILSLRKEKESLLDQIEEMRKELSQVKSAARENESFKREQDRIKSRLERINKKIETVLNQEAAVSFSAPGGNHEERPQ